MSNLTINIPDAQIEKVINTFLQQKEKQEEKILDAKEASEIIGITTQTLHKYTLKGVIPYHKVDGIRNKLFLLSEIRDINKSNLKRI